MLSVVAGMPPFQVMENTGGLTILSKNDDSLSSPSTYILLRSSFEIVLAPSLMYQLHFKLSAD